MYLVVVGAGETGRNLVELAVKDGHEVVVVEEDDGRASDISSGYDCLVLNADATTDGTLEEADVDRADAVVSTTDADATNIMVMLLAQEHGVPNLLSVVNESSHLPVFEKIGVNVIQNPQRLIAEHLYHSVQYPSAGDFIELEVGMELVEITVEEGSPAVGQTLTDLRTPGTLPEGSFVVAVERDGELILPESATELATGDVVTVLSTDEYVDDAIATFSPDE